MEPFDEALDRKIRSLAAEKELIQVQVAERRAKTPKAIHALMEDLIRRQVAGEWVPSVEDQDMAVDDERGSPFGLFSRQMFRRGTDPFLIIQNRYSTRMNSHKRSIRPWKLFRLSRR